MKKLFLSVIVLFICLHVYGQNVNKPIIETYDEILSNYTIDCNYFSSWTYKQISNQLNLSAYKNAITPLVQVAKPQFNNANLNGKDVNFGFFYGKKKELGWGIGLVFISSTEDIYINRFREEFQSLDNSYNIFRQIITDTNVVGVNKKGIIERIVNSNTYIPFLFKFKHNVNRHWGYTADAGVLLNIATTILYKTNADFNYEAIYAYVPNSNTFYDNSLQPSGTDWLITRANFFAHNPKGDINEYFSNIYSSGFNVGLQKAPNNLNGKITKLYPQLGTLIKIEGTYQFNNHFVVLCGGYYLHQVFNNTGTDTWMLTNHVGDYNSLLNGINHSVVNTFGINLGIRYFIGGHNDRDRDGVPDYKDRCPDTPGLKEFYGCKDTDRDGIPDTEDECPLHPGPECTKGCPDRDGDCIADKDDNCPDDAGLIELQGCPDGSNALVLDNNDTTNNNLGSKYDSEDSLPENILLSSKTIYFDFDRGIIDKKSESKFKEMIKVISKNNKLILFIAGYANSKGGVSYSHFISFSKAKNLRKYLEKRNIKKDKIYINAKPSKKQTNKSDKLNNTLIFQLLLPTEF